ncbi:hypothetical protein [Sphingopyxis sp. R3-92]|uniref:hypothetical protein n=1 Tax=Sphingopyxis sp. R3-92 TaxID=3158553 RepID=UPI003EE7F6DF
MVGNFIYALLSSRWNDSGVYRRSMPLAILGPFLPRQFGFNAPRPAAAECEHLNIKYFWWFTPDIPFGPDKFGLFPFPLA